MPHRHVAALSASLFASIAAVVGWSWCHLLANEAVAVTWRHLRGPAALHAAVVFAVVGWVLAPTAASEEGRPARPSPALLVSTVLAGGALTGGWLVLTFGKDLLFGLRYGLYGGGLMLPAAALLVALVRRVGAGRRGSVVARAETRALLAGVAVIVGCSTVLAFLDWPAVVVGRAETPFALFVLVGAAIVVVLVLLTDLVALARVKRLASSFDEDAPGEGRVTGERGDLDLGVGDEVRVELSPGMAYRGGGQAILRVFGDPAEASLVLGRAVRRGACLVAILEGVGLLHGAARTVDVAAFTSAEVCERQGPGRPRTVLDAGGAEVCREAALLSERAGHPAEVASRLHRSACQRGAEESCFALTLMERHALKERLVSVR
ncbi:hypothetical protein [Chondromyces crocatus]|uniref:Uncharacterized protein n=1 Tax=Chondromyces crocatus TaxID=52 RepID=A0A0K1EI45_CHOCO|nr:hypothetical protein [Chondromyces crocatus]AKT40529.1 uncharacterized protein CMC5_046840 [Chondromyces crocatus]